MSWPTYPLDQLGFLSRGRSRHRPRDAAHLYGGPFPFVQTGDVKKAPLYLKEYSQTYSEAGLAQSKIWPAGTLCITIAANIAETAILDIEACFPDSIIGFNPDPEKTSAKFIKYQFDALLSGQMRTISQGAAQDNLSQAKLLTFEFNIPDLPIQERIVAILSAYDDLIENNRRRIALLEQAARLLYREWFVHFRFPGHETAKFVDGLPEGWAEQKVGDLGSVVTGKTPSKKVSENFDGHIPFIKTPDMHGNIFVVSTGETLTEQGAKSQVKKTLPLRSILVSCIGTVGVVAMNANHAQFNQQINAVVPDAGNSNYYVYFALESIKSRLEAIGGGVTMANVSKSKFESVPVLVPSTSKQQDFHVVVEPIFDQILQLAKTNAELTSARDLLLPRLMDGRISV
jgi:type I restriction enzyme, S subunit